VLRSVGWAYISSCRVSPQFHTGCRAQLKRGLLLAIAAACPNGADQKSQDIGGAIDRWHWDGYQLGARDVGFAGGAGEQPVVADAMKPFGRTMHLSISLRRPVYLGYGSIVQPFDRPISTASAPHCSAHPGPRFPPSRLIRRLPTERAALPSDGQASDNP